MFYDMTLFPKEPVYCHIRRSNKNNPFWLLTINQSYEDWDHKPQVSVFFESEAALIAFCKSVAEAAEGVTK